jgi:2-phospho-L-lactate guanylyltransferase
MRERATGIPLAHMRTAAILPVKRFSLAKQRLGESVTEQLRLDLARAMVGDVLAALSRCAAIELTIVVTNEPTVGAAADYTGAIVVADTAESGQSAAVSIGVERALAEGAERALCIPGDCPALDPDELEILLDADHSEVVIVPDRHGAGTNGLLLMPPDVMTPSFGPGSRERHGELAARAGARSQVEQLSSLRLDIDTGADLAVLRELLAGGQGQAPRTRSVLGMVEGPWRSSQPAA